MHAKAQGFGGLHVEEKADGAVLRLEWDVLQDSLFLDGCHRFLGGIIQVICCQDGQAALGQNPFSLVDVGPWKGAKKREEKQCYNRRQPTLQKWLNKGEPDLPSARMLKTTLCERRRVPLEESIHTDRWSHGSMVAHATADPNVAECEQRAKGQFVCARVCVSAPPAVVRSGVAGAGWYGDACAPSRPTTNQRERKRKTLGDTLCNPEALRTELAASQHCTPLGQMQAWQACHNTGQGAPQRTEEGEWMRAREREWTRWWCWWGSRAKGQMKQNWPLAAKNNKSQLFMWHLLIRHMKNKNWICLMCHQRLSTLLKHLIIFFSPRTTCICLFFLIRFQISFITFWRTSLCPCWTLQLTITPVWSFLTSNSNKQHLKKSLKKVLEKHFIVTLHVTFAVYGQRVCWDSLYISVSLYSLGC